MRTLKYSKQREAIKAFLQNNHSHPTADEVYAAIRQQFPNISLGTVYRNLNLLAESGEIRKMSYLSGPDHFDFDTSQHYHFVCRECGHVYDMPVEAMEKISHTIRKNVPGTVDSHDLVFYGICRECLAKQKHGRSA